MLKAILISHALICVSFGLKQMKRSTQLPTGCVHRERPKVERTVKNFWVGIGNTSKKVLSLRQSCPNGSQLIACCTTACISSSTTDYWGQWYAILVQHTTFTLCHLQTHASLWTPACGPKPAKYFNAKLWRADGDFRGDADAAAAVLALVVAFCEEVLVAEDSLKPYIESMQCLQKLVCCIWACKVSPSAALQLDELQKKHFDAYAKAWSKETIRPKWHYGLHVQAQVQRCNKMLDTWALERKHKFFKKTNYRKLGICTNFRCLSSAGTIHG